MNENSQDGVLSVIGEQERAAIDMQIATAKQYPRHLPTVKQSMLDFATLDVETAEGCFYTLPRGGKSIQGPGVRLAEIALSCYGNIRAGARVIENDGKTITAQAVCHDLERNVVVSYETKRRITNSSGQTYNEDMQVVTGNAACAVAFRNAVYKVVPGVLVKPVYEAAVKVAIGDSKTLSQRRTKALTTFAKMGVGEDRVLGMLGVKAVEDIGLKQLETLIGLHTAIKEGTTTVDETFPESSAVFHPPAEPKSSEELTQALEESVEALPDDRSIHEQALGILDGTEHKEDALVSLVKKRGMCGKKVEEVMQMTEKSAQWIVENKVVLLKQLDLNVKGVKS